MAGVTCLAGGLVAQQASGPQEFEQKPLPEFSMTTLDGKRVSSNDLKGKVLLIDFWATWCGPCKKAAPALQALHEKYGKKGLVVIGANTSERGPDGKNIRTPDNAIAYVKENRYTYMFTYGNDDYKTSLKVRGIPTMFIVDKQGIVRKVQVGYSPELEGMLDSTIRELL